MMICAAEFPLGTSAVAATFTIRPSDNVAQLVAAAPAGSTFVFDGGEYRELSLQAKDGDVFLGLNGATLNGARIIHDFARDGRGFAATVSDLQWSTSSHAECMKEWLCKPDTDVYVDGVRQRLVTGSPSSGEYAVDAAKRILRLGSDPDGHIVELAVTRFAIFGSASDVTIKGLAVLHYANPAQSGAVGGVGTGARWTVSECDVHDNHGAGVHVGDAGQIIGSHLHRNGQLGASASADEFIRNVVIRENEIAHNNELRFDPAWEAGGVKAVRVDGITFSANRVHDNLGPGLWTDIDSANATYAGNIAKDNFRSGIQHEISGAADIHHNTLENNGFGTPVWGWGAQIIIMNSQQVNVHDNRLTIGKKGTAGISLIHQDRGSGDFGKWVMANSAVYDNSLTYSTEDGFAAVALLTDIPGLDLRSARISLDRNRYVVPSLDGAYWVWSPTRKPLTWVALRARGEEHNGELSLLHRD